MAVRCQVLLDESLEETALFELFFDPGAEFINLEDAERIPTVQGVWHHVGNVHQTRVLLCLLGTHLDLMERLVEAFLVNSVLHHVN